MTGSQQEWQLRAVVPAVADVLCDPPHWPRLLPHVPRVVVQPDGRLALTFSWHGLRLSSVCRTTTAHTDTACTLLLEHDAGLLRGLREEWTATTQTRAHLALHLNTTWTTAAALPRRALVQRIYTAGVLPATAAQLVLLAESDWRSRAAQVAVGSVPAE